MAKSLRAFVEKVSSFEGAEIPQNRDLEEANFDVDGFIEAFELVGHRTGSDDDFGGDSSSSSDMDMDMDMDMDTDDFHELLEYPKSMLGEVGSDDSFMNSYSESMTNELKSTTLDKIFICVQQVTTIRTQEGASSAMDDMSNDQSPVDVDLNLVKNFLDSSSQEGLPGPASNLLGSPGLKLPDDKANAENRNKWLE